MITTILKTTTLVKRSHYLFTANQGYESEIILGGLFENQVRGKCPRLITQTLRYVPKLNYTSKTLQVPININYFL